MPGPRLAPTLLCLLSVWKILMLTANHQQVGRCQLKQRTALCNNRNLSSVPAGLPDNIEELQLNDNHIQTIQEGALSYSSLWTLSLACNDLQKLQLTTFQDTKMIENLNLANNNFHANSHETGEALKTLPRLKVLDLSENKLDEDMAATILHNLTSLEYLNLSGNVMQRLDETSFRYLRQLKELDLQKNFIFEIEGAFDSNHKLQRLNLAFNYLPCLYDFHMTQLVVLNASYNSIEWFISRPDLNDTFQLETFDLSHNRLLFFPVLPNKSRLRNLYLSHNNVRFYEHLAGDAAGMNSTVEFYNIKHSENITAQLWDEGLHGDISSLEILDLRGNQVRYFPKGFIQKMPTLQRLQMNGNCLETLNLTTEQLSSSLYELDVSNNRLNQIVADEGTIHALSNLTYLNLSFNKLEEVSSGFFSSLANLRSVDLSYNDITLCFPEEAENMTDGLAACVDWKNILSLRQLYLKGCNLEITPLSAFAGLSLTHLELSDNPGLILQGSIQSLSRTLQHLGLGNTHIQDFDFSHFKSLKYLNISRNSIPCLPHSLLNLGLEVLDLRDNRLTTIPPEDAKALAVTLQTILLTGNPFNCCQTEWLEAFKIVNVVGLSEIECEDLFLMEHRLENFQAFTCLKEDGESIFWYIMLFVPICFSFLGISIIVLLSFKPKKLHKSIKKKCLKPTSY